MVIEAHGDLACARRRKWFADRTPEIPLSPTGGRSDPTPPGWGLWPSPLAEDPLGMLLNWTAATLAVAFGTIGVGLRIGNRF